MSPSETPAGNDLEIQLPARRRVYLRIDELPDNATPPDPRGRRVLLAKPSAHVFQLARRADALPAGSDESVAALYDLASALMPELPREDVERVSAETVYHILDVFQQPIAELERLAKNAEPPLAKAVKGSSSRTPSPTRSRGSRKGSASGSET